MCILFIYTGGDVGNGYKLILANNRDEYFHRPASFAAPWIEDGDIIGGRDMVPGREGGTWLALSVKRRKLGALLNLPGEKNFEKAKVISGRGSIVANFVMGDKATQEYMEHFHQHGNEYSSFNLITVEVGEDCSTAYHFSNANDTLHTYQRGEVLGFGNSLPDRPFTKVQMGRERFRKIVEEGMNKDDLVQALLELLQWKEHHVPDPELMRRTAIPQASAICFSAPEKSFGTRTHSVILVDKDDNLDMFEWTMVPGDKDWHKTHLQRKLASFASDSS